jgi:hypothetical protein
MPSLKLCLRVNDWGRLIPVGGGDEVGKGYKKVNNVQILCTINVNGKKIPVETIS